MTSDIISRSVELDKLVQEKLRGFWTEASTSTNELKTTINNLRYLVYIINQDRIVKYKQVLRQELIAKSSRPSESQSESQSAKRSYNCDIEVIQQYELYEATENYSDIGTVINTSIVPSSYEPTEREYSPFSVSPLISPRLLKLEDSLDFSESFPGEKIEKSSSKSFLINSDTNNVNISIYTLNCTNYLRQHYGDDMISPSCMNSDKHSRESSIDNI
jgi:hypothetical protein